MRGFVLVSLSLRVCQIGGFGGILFSTFGRVSCGRCGESWGVVLRTPCNSSLRLELRVLQLRPQVEFGSYGFHSVLILLG